MKKAYIIGIVLVLAGITYLISASSDVSSYATFKEAAAGTNVKIAGQLVKNKPIVYDPVTDANLFTFFMEDNNGEVKQVKYYGAKPQDFEMSEQIVVTGKMVDEHIEASELLLKCPSKYKDQEVLLRDNG
jgi:cytochrome c-type biogenesis protein CcmE